MTKTLEPWTPGKKFGLWTVIIPAGRRIKDGVRSRDKMSLCVCNCGHLSAVRRTDLVNGHSGGCRSCTTKGAPRRTRQKSPRISSYISNSKEYNSWQAMKKRCNNPKAPSFKNYGGRGIKICKRWETFENFYADMGKAPDGYSIERKDNDKGYSPENCVWANVEQQNNNQRSNVRISHNGKTQNLSQWCKELGIKRSTLASRIKRGWTIEDALSVEVRRKDQLAP